uniref:Retrotransposon Copia-like N-terminal domain-containing protein n=1 Tax=Nicotiana tabacum TaxID=4097 RepID=A0A1S3YND2_TOBAC|nr:PREDICTED: uncharacterized protein LOC107778117 [Nicotiana tabacum]
MIVSLSARNKIGFIDGTVLQPPENSPQFTQWDRCNNMVISWLTNSLTPKIAESVQYSSTAQSIWTQLNKSSCTCAAKSELQREDDENKLHQFLIWHNDTYIGVKSNLLMMQPPPSLDTTHKILLQDERQRQVSSPSQFHTDSDSFNAHLNNKFSGTPALLNSSIKEFPPGFKFTKGKRTTANVEVQGYPNSVGFQNTIESSHSPAEGSSKSEFLIPGLTKDQYSQLMMLL